MQKLAIYLSNYLARKYQKNKGQEDSLTRNIELVNGEAIQLKGIPSNEIPNYISSRQSYIDIVIQFLSRPGIMIFILLNIIAYSLADENLDHELRFAIQFICPLACNIIMYLITTCYFEYKKYLADKQINERKVNIFKKLKKFKLKKIMQQDEEPQKSEIKQVMTELHPKNDIVIQQPMNQVRNSDSKQPIINSFGDKSKFYQAANHQDAKEEQKVQMFQTIRWQNLNVGDIIILQKNETAPADVLILECSQERCTANATQITGNTTEFTKAPNILTAVPKMHQFKGNSLEYRLMMTGNVLYDRVDYEGTFSGYIKLKNDPQSVEFTKKNILFREQVLQSCDYIYGLVLYAGKHCKYYQQVPHKRKTRSFFIKKLNRFNQFTFLLIIFLSLVSWTIESVNNEAVSWNIGNLAQFLLVYLNMIPQYIYCVLDCSVLIQALYKEHQFQQELIENEIKGTSFDDHIRMNRICNLQNNTHIADLALIDCAIFDKTGTLTLPQFKLKMLFINEQLFKIRYKTFRNHQDWKQFQKEVKDNIQMQNIDEESDSIQKQISSIKVSPTNKPMSPAKRTSIIPDWKLEENLINCDQNDQDQFGETSNQEEANFNPKDIEDDHPKLQEIHRSRVPKPFQQDLWTSQFDFNQLPGPTERRSRMSPLRKQSERAPILEKIEAKKKMSAERNFKGIHQIQEEWKQENQDMIFHEKELYVRMENADTKEVFDEALFVLSICHDTVTKFCKLEDFFKHEQLSQLDQLQINLAAQYNYRFIGATKDSKKYILDINDIFIEVPVTVHNLGNYRISVIKESQKEKDYSSLDEEVQYVQYVREDGLEFSNSLIIDRDEKDGWESLIHKFQINGCRPIVFYKSIMNQQEYSDFLKDPQHELMNRIKYFEIVMIIGVAEKIRNRVPEVIKNLMSAEIQTWIASGDSLEKVLPIAYKTGIIQQKAPIIHIESVDVATQIQQLIQSLYNNQIKQIKDINQEKTQLERMPSPNPANKRRSVNFGRRASTRNVLPGMIAQNQRITPNALLISGAAIEKISEDMNLMNHLAFLISFTYTVVGYRMNREQKSVLVKILQKKQVWERKVLVVGDSLSDALMMSYANYCMQFQNHRVFLETKIEKVDSICRIRKERQSQKGYSADKIIKHPIPKEKFTYSQTSMIPSSDLLIKDYDDLISLIFYEGRVHAEFLDNLISYAFYRCYLICLWLFFYLIFNGVIEMFPPFQVYQAIIFIIGSGYLFSFRYLQDDKTMAFREQLVYLYNQNQVNFRKSRYLQYLYKVIFYSFIESLILAALSTQIDFRFMTGFQLQNNMNHYQCFCTILLLELIKLFDTASLIQILILFIAYFIISFLSYLEYFQEIKDQFSYFASEQSLFFIILTVSIPYLFHKLLIINWSFITRESIYSKEEKRQIIEKQQIIGIYYSKKPKDSYSIILQISKFVLKLFKNEEEIDSTIRAMLSGMAIGEKTKKINKFTQQFENIQLELKYQLSTIQSIMEYYKFYYLFSWMLVEGAILVQLWINSAIYDYSWLLYLSFSYNGLQVLIALSIYTKAFKKYQFRVSKILISSRLIYKILYDIYFFQDNNNNLNDMLIMQLFMLQPLNDDRPLTIVLYCFIIAISFIVRFSSNNTTGYQNINNYIQLNYYLIAFMQCLLSSGMHCKFQRSYRENYIQTLIMSQETTAKQDTLRILMPKFIRNIINQKGEFDISEHQGQVAVLFCDICEFDTIIKIQQQNVVHLLDTLFRQYDSLCTQYNLQKIETVGKTYMAAAGLKHSTAQTNVNPVLRAIQVAFEMKKFALSQSFGQTEKIVVKIGVHYGNVIAGVIGFHKPQFSLIGDTINTTSRVCSTSQDGQIKISQEAFREVASQTEYIFNQDIVNAKGKGELITYIVSQQEKVDNRLKKLLKYKEERSQKIIFARHNIEDMLKLQRKSIFEFRSTKKPSLILPSIKMVGQGSSIQHRSSINLDKGGTPKSHTGEGEQGQVQGQVRTLDGQNLIECLEIKLSKYNQQLNFEEGYDYPIYEFEKEKLKLLHNNEDEFKEEDVLILDRNKFYMDFDKDVDEDTVLQFYDQLGQQNRGLIILLNVSAGILILIYNSSTFLIEGEFGYYSVWILNLVYGYLIVVINIGFVFALINHPDQYCKQKYFLLSYLFTITWWILHIFSMDEGLLGENLIALGIFLSFLTQLNPIIQMKYKFVETLSLVSINLMVILIKQWDYTLIYYALVLQMIFISTQYYKFFNNVQSYNNKYKLESKHEQLDSLVKHQLPSHMLEQFLKTHQSSKVVLKDSYENVTLLFADIAGFTSYSSEVSPEQVVVMLRNLFTEFDKQSQLKNVYKLYTIGDCYVVMGMIDAKDRNPALEAKNVVELGFEMINIIKRVREIINFKNLDMRIGVHTGKTIGGVLGTDIVRYDIYGPDVLIANKMESRGAQGQVQVSQATKDVLEICYPEEFKYDHNATIEIPSIDRKTDGYFISVKTDYEPSLYLQNQNQEL